MSPKISITISGHDRFPSLPFFSWDLVYFVSHLLSLTLSLSLSFYFNSFYTEVSVSLDGVGVEFF